MESINALSQNQLLRSKILRKAKYRCESCGGINHKEGYYNESGTFIETDQHMKIWAMNQGIKVIRISLQVIQVFIEPMSQKGIKYRVMCRKCGMRLKNDIREYRKRASKNPGK